MCFSSRSNRLLSSGLSSHSSVSVPLSSVSKWSMFSRNLCTQTLCHSSLAPLHPPLPSVLDPSNFLFSPGYTVTCNSPLAALPAPRLLTLPALWSLCDQDELLLPRPTAKRMLMTVPFRRNYTGYTVPKTTDPPTVPV